MERTAVELVLRDGLQRATVEAICDAADVSPRTFFNYFDSKEDAILGLPDFELADADVRVASAQHDNDVIESLIGLMVELARPALENTALSKPRSEILRRYPELFTKKIARLTLITDDLAGAARTLVALDPRFVADPPSPSADLILALCTSAVRTAAREWIAASSGGSVHTITIRASALVREVVEKLR
jgi:AcrR family transcriptional regulator